MKKLSFSIQNPIHEGWYADPEARFYEGKYVIYATKSLPFDEQTNQVCFTSEDLTRWELHEDILDLSGFPWATRAIWAPTVIEKDGRYYYIFASNDIHSTAEKGGLEIAVSESPTGPFRALLDRPLVNSFDHGAQPIDAHLFRDDDGTVWLFWGGWGHCNLARMREDMKGFVPFPDGEEIKDITPPDYVEGPCMFRRAGKYYFMWSAGNWTTGTYRVNAAFADSPMGPFSTPTRVLDSGDGSVGNGPGHNGYLYLPEEDRFLIVYHRHKPGETDGNARYLCIDPMDFDGEGNLLPVRMSHAWRFADGKITFE